MFTEYVLSKNNVDPNDYILSTVVSTRFIEKQTLLHNCQHESTLTGFKHIGNLAWNLEQHKKRVLFAFEESIGFMVGTTVLEKDGISALLLAFCLVNELDCSLSDYLNKIYSKYDCKATQYNSYYFCPAEQITKAFEVVRQRVGEDKDVVIVKDYFPSNMLSLRLDGDTSLTLRASGTEPKLKFYSECIGKRQVQDLQSKVNETLNFLLDGLDLCIKSD